MSDAVPVAADMGGSAKRGSSFRGLARKAGEAAAPVESEEAAREEGKKKKKTTTTTTSTVYRMSQEQIDGILSWDLPATDYEPRGFSDETMEMCGHLIIKGFEGRNRLLRKRRELQHYVREQLELHGVVDIDDRMQYM
uniref:Uncharacterized protein n=1 Tax=Oryza barthii TaxID=65489 RepID=A0A0D3HM67_9ORYZ